MYYTSYLQWYLPWFPKKALAQDSYPCVRKKHI